MTLTTAQRAQTMLRDGEEVLAVLITITHSDLAAPIRLVSTPVEELQADPKIYGAISNGQTFYFVPFELAPAEESERPGGRAQLSIPHFSPDLVLDFASTFRALTGRATVAAQVMITPDLDNPVMEFSAWDLTTSRTNDEELVFELRADGLTFEPAPTGTYDRRQFPGLFA